MKIPWPQPEPTQLKWLSHSSAKRLSDCRLAYAFSSDARFTQAQRITQFTAVGLVVHQVIQRTANKQYEVGVLDTARDIARRLWQECLDQTWDQMRSEWAPAEPPEPSTWPFFAQRKVQTVRVISALITDFLARPPRQPARSGDFTGLPALPWVERRLSDDARELFGTPDRVERRADGVWVVDIKTGANQGEPTSDQVDQLLLYAHLVSVNLGEKPVGLSIVTPGGQSFSVEFEWQDVVECVKSLLELRSGFNADQWPYAASPSESGCRYCLYRGLCEDFYASREPEWTRFLPLVGRVEAVVGELPWLSVAIVVQEPREFTDLRTRVVDVPWTTRPVQGDFVSVSNVNLVGEGALARGNWDSLTWNFNRMEN